MTLDDKEWKAVKFKEIFDEIYIAKSTDLVNIKEGNVPFVGRSSTNNGFQGEFDIDLGKINKKIQLQLEWLESQELSFRNIILHVVRIY